MSYKFAGAKLFTKMANKRVYDSHIDFVKVIQCASYASTK